MNLTIKILIVEDEPRLREVIELMLKDSYDIELVKNGGEALKKMEEKKFDFVITDYRMPIMSGLELTKKIRINATSLELPILMITGTPPEMKELIEAGVDYCLLKPFTPDKLIASIEKLLKPNH